METFLSSTLGVAITEISDRTQLLALFSAARFAHKNAIAVDIFITTLLNHLVLITLGIWPVSAISPEVMEWVVGDNFITAGLWLLLSDKDESPDSRRLKYGAFTATVVLSFLTEASDKIQIAMILLAAKYQSILLVVIDDIVSLMVASVSAVYLGGMLTRKIPAKTVRIATCILFCLLGILTLLGDGIALRAV